MRGTVRKYIFRICTWNETPAEFSTACRGQFSIGIRRKRFAVPPYKSSTGPQTESLISPKQMLVAWVSELTHPTDFCTYGPREVKGNEGNRESRMREHHSDAFSYSNEQSQMKGSPQGAPFFAYFL